MAKLEPYLLAIVCRGGGRLACMRAGRARQSPARVAMSDGDQQ